MLILQQSNLKIDRLKFIRITKMTITTEDGDRQNIFAKEPQIKLMEVSVTHNEKAEQLNGRVAMLGIIAALGAYAVTGQIIPGLW